MRFCQCVLGGYGKCCQDIWTNGMTTSGTSSSNAGIFTVSNRSKVSKLPGGKWLSKNAIMPPRVFDTWQEAMDWANHRFRMINNNVGTGYYGRTLTA